MNNYVVKRAGFIYAGLSGKIATGSIIIPSNQPFGEWDKIFADPSMTVAAIDRVVHHATIIEIQAESYHKYVLVTPRKRC